MTGAMIRREREKRGWSQLAVSAAIGTGQSNVSNWESGADLKVSTLRRLADVYGMDLHIEFREKVDERLAVLEGK